VRSIGVEEARTRLGRLAEEVVAGDDAVVLTRRGRPLAVLLSPAEYERLQESRRRLAQVELAARLGEIRERVAAAGLDVSVVEEAIAAARGLD
jgi:antitoxin YefM